MGFRRLQKIDWADVEACHTYEKVENKVTGEVAIIETTEKTLKDSGKILPPVSVANIDTMVKAGVQLKETSSACVKGTERQINETINTLLKKTENHQYIEQ